MPRRCFVVVEFVRKHRIPSQEALPVAKYGALVSLARNRQRKEQDSADFRSIACPYDGNIDRDSLHRLADEVPGDGDGMLEFTELATVDIPFPLWSSLAVQRQFNLFPANRYDWSILPYRTFRCPFEHPEPEQFDTVAAVTQTHFDGTPE